MATVDQASRVGLDSSEPVKLGVVGAEVQQLASNPQIAALLQERNTRWRAAGLKAGEVR